jgi:hypothetical protein
MGAAPEWGRLIPAKTPWSLKDFAVRTIFERKFEQKRHWKSGAYAKDRKIVKNFTKHG